LECSIIPLRSHGVDSNIEEFVEPRVKRFKYSDGSGTEKSGIEIDTMSIFKEVDYFARILRNTWDFSHV